MPVLMLILPWYLMTSSWRGTAGGRGCRYCCDDEEGGVRLPISLVTRDGARMGQFSGQLT